MIPQGLHQFLVTDLMAMLACVLAAVCCGVLGNFLVLRRMSLMGDAISHAVLPGLVLAFMVTGSRATWPMLVGAGVSGLVTVGLVGLVRRLGRLDTGTSMGVVFSILFALGVVMIERVARQVDLDPECVLYGAAETLFWLDAPRQWGELVSAPALAGVPRQVVTLAVMSLVAILFVGVLFKELRIAAFDPDLATSLGFRASWVNGALMAMVAAATVASFEAVGSILVVAMLVCPAATARLLTDRLASQVAASIALASASGVLGYILGAFGPGWFGGERAVSVTGMMSVVAGLFLAAAVVASPSHGIVAKLVRRLRLAVTVAREDLLATLFRAEERGGEPGSADRAMPRGWIGRLAERQALRRGEVVLASDPGERRSVASGQGRRLALSAKGRAASQVVVRTHRLWEGFLVREVGLRSDHVHDTAMRVEHLRDPSARRISPGVMGDRDPHGSPIPSGDTPQP